MGILKAVKKVAKKAVVNKADAAQSAAGNAGRFASGDKTAVSSGNNGIKKILNKSGRKNLFGN